jgi:predicted ATPase
MRAAAAPRLLYQGTLLSKDFSRTASRLIEMAHPKR